MTPHGQPHVVPIWGVLVEHELYLETGAPGTTKNRNLAKNAEIVVHLDNSDDAVIVRGRAVPIAPPAALGRALADAFHAKYPGYRPESTSWADGGLVRVEPRTVLAWRDMPTATRWRLGARQSEGPAATRDP